MVRAYRLILLAAFAVACSSAAAAQQTTAGIAGVARDPSGGVLPGVSVEATSPVLIERVRAVTTDGEGRYNIVDLPPGTYVVTFSLAGFATIRRDATEPTAASNFAQTNLKPWKTPTQVVDPRLLQVSAQLTF